MPTARGTGMRHARARALGGVTRGALVRGPFGSGRGLYHGSSCVPSAAST